MAILLKHNNGKHEWLDDSCQHYLWPSAPLPAIPIAVLIDPEGVSMFVGAFYLNLHDLQGLTE